MEEQKEVTTYEEAIKSLQAVIVIDSFKSRFKPISAELLKALFPIAGIPMLAYVIEFLIQNSVREIFIASQQKNELSRFISSLKLKKRGVKIQVITLVEQPKSLGDVLREINQNGVLVNDFLLVRSDMISNASVKGALKAHYEAKAKSKEKKLILTKIFVPMSYQNPLRYDSSEITLIMEQQSKELYTYEDSSSKYLRLFEHGLPLKQSNTALQVRHDLFDTEMAIVSREVLAYFNDNFDYSGLQGDFINSIYANEVIDDRILAYELEGCGYFAIVADPRIYGLVAQDIIQRKVHPIVLDATLFTENLQFKNSSQQLVGWNKYIRVESVFTSLQMNSQISGNSIVGLDSKIGVNSAIFQSVVGNKCKIGKGVQIRNSHIWDEVTIEDNVLIEGSILAQGCVVKKGARLCRGCMLSTDVIVREGAVLPENTIGSIQTFNVDRQKFEYSNSTDDYFEVGCLPYMPRDYILAERECMGFVKGAGEEESDLDDSEEEEINEKEKFTLEVQDTITKCRKKALQVSHILMEVKSLKMTNNMTYQDTIEATLPSILDLMKERQNSNVQEFIKKVCDVLTEWEPFLRELLYEEEDFQQLIRCIEVYCGSEANSFNSAFHIILQTLFKVKVLKENHILKWYEQVVQSLAQAKERQEEEANLVDEIFEFIAPEMREKFRKNMEGFIDKLKEQQTAPQEEEEYDEEYEDEEEK